MELREKVLQDLLWVGKIVETLLFFLVFFSSLMSIVAPLVFYHG